MVQQLGLPRKRVSGLHSPLSLVNKLLVAFGRVCVKGRVGVQFPSGWDRMRRRRFFMQQTSPCGQRWMRRCCAGGMEAFLPPQHQLWWKVIGSKPPCQEYSFLGIPPNPSKIDLTKFTAELVCREGLTRLRHLQVGCTAQLHLPPLLPSIPAYQPLKMAVECMHPAALAARL